MEVVLPTRDIWTGKLKSVSPINGPAGGTVERIGIVEIESLEGDMPAWANPNTGEPIPEKHFVKRIQQFSQTTIDDVVDSCWVNKKVNHHLSLTIIVFQRMTNRLSNPKSIFNSV